MAWTNTVKVLELKEDVTKNNTPMLRIKWRDTANDKEFNKICFDPNLFSVFKIAKEESTATVVVTINDEKNITDAVLGGVSEASPETQREAKEVGTEVLKAMQDGYSTRKIEPQERGMWWKELGEMIRVGQLGQYFPKNHEAMLRFYLSEMCGAIGFDLKNE